jgi:glutathione S-transferase
VNLILPSTQWAPAFQDGDTILWEPGTVLNLLLEVYDTECKLYAPPRSAKRAKYLHLQQFIIATVYPFVASLYIHTLDDKSDQDESYVTSAKGKWKDPLAPILIKWLGDGPYFLGDQLSVVDLLTCKPLSNINSMGMLLETPTLKALFDDKSARPHSSLPMEGQQPFLINRNLARGRWYPWMHEPPISPVI